MRTLAIGGELSRQDLQTTFDRAGLIAQIRTAYKLGDVEVAILIAQKYFLRTNTLVGVVVVAVSNGGVQRIDIVHAGGGEGIVGVEFGAGANLELRIYNELGALAEELGLKVRARSSPWCRTNHCGVELRKWSRDKHPGALSRSILPRRLPGFQGLVLWVAWKPAAGRPERHQAWARLKA